MRKKYFLKGIWDPPQFEKDCFGNPPAIALIKRDVNQIISSLRFQSLRRYFHQRFWEQETMDAEYSERIEGLPRIESLADHSWHVADIVLLVGVHFRMLDLGKCAQMAVLHDKL